jgi:hypothetical protein
VNSVTVTADPLTWTKHLAMETVLAVVRLLTGFSFTAAANYFPDSPRHIVGLSLLTTRQRLLQKKNASI